MNWLTKLFSRTKKPKEYNNYDVGYLEATIEYNDGRTFLVKFEGSVSLDCYGSELTFFFYKVNTARNKFDKWIVNVPSFLQLNDKEYLPSSLIKNIKITKEESKIETVEALK